SARLAKWRRRNRKQVARAALVCFGIAAVCAFVLLGIQRNHTQRLAAIGALHRFDLAVLEARQNLCIPDADKDLLASGLAAAESALGEFDALDNLDWREHGHFKRLETADQQRVATGVDELVALTKLASLRIHGDSENELSPLPPATTESASVVSCQLMVDHKFSEAAALLSDAVERRRRDPVLWIQLGVSQMALRETEAAVASLTAATAIQPDSAVAWRNRGYALMDAGQHERALTDLNRAVTLTPQSPTLHLNLAIALFELGQLEKAERTASLALELGADQPRAWLLRARIRTKLGNEPGATADREAAALSTPINAEDWAALAVDCRRDSDPEQALRYLAAGLKKFPRSLILLRNQVHILGDVMKQPDKALEPVERILEIRPGDIRARLSQAVILAKIGKSEESLALCESIAAEDLRPIDHLQLACAYALCAKENKDAIAKSLRQLRASLANNPKLVMRAARDSDLAILREHPDYRRSVHAAAQLIQPVNYTAGPGLEEQKK
ncbi:MAG: tetratricopeptide repeat protein, partial [Pirellulales bacterium]|nr:tetratricopeptide repeat protein [Pirellulales bacterium]